jgi:hypothetical protein
MKENRFIRATTKIDRTEQDTREREARSRRKIVPLARKRLNMRMGNNKT